MEYELMIISISANIFINIHHIFIWISNPNNCLRVVQSRRRFFLIERHVVFAKARFGVPKPCLLRFRLAASVFFFYVVPFLKKRCSCYRKQHVWQMVENI